ncbi:hypothetical protein C3K47_11210 [Solitalea longa]|uniref:Methyltransferase FkbM domain-containing protein n=1 Tax=Solitalea longa TaxID=2079460 RepID=A0A2S5A223_9SPHI|nr:FkbM family methyltransferase [Solitalea longa]POY36312.1 hypothetical protein C3K47_11210 [Solitalea longa]
MIYSFFHKFRFSHFLGRNLLTESFLPFKFLYGLFKKINYSKTITKNGVSFTVLLKNGIGTMNFIDDYEKWFDEIIPKVLSSPNSVFIDIGANVGQTLLKTLPYYPEVKYYAIEPNKSCVDYLESLCKVNNFKRVKIINYALSDVVGETELLMRYQDDLLATTTPSFRKYTKYSSKVVVPTTTGDHLIAKENLKEISLIKIDVEGGEYKVLAGLVDSIRIYQPYIICEILPLASKAEDVKNFRILSAQKIFEILSDLDYSVYNIANKRTIQQVEELSLSLESCNYLFIPKSIDHYSVKPTNKKHSNTMEAMLQPI